MMKKKKKEVIDKLNDQFIQSFKIDISICLRLMGNNLPEIAFYLAVLKIHRNIDNYTLREIIIKNAPTNFSIYHDLCIGHLDYYDSDFSFAIKYQKFDIINYLIFVHGYEIILCDLFYSFPKLDKNMFDYLTSDKERVLNVLNVLEIFNLDENHFNFFKFFCYGEKKLFEKYADYIIQKERPNYRNIIDLLIAVNKIDILDIILDKTTAECFSEDLLLGIIRNNRYDLFKKYFNGEDLKSIDILKSKNKEFFSVVISSCVCHPKNCIHIKILDYVFEKNIFKWTNFDTYLFYDEIDSNNIKEYFISKNLHKKLNFAEYEKDLYDKSRDDEEDRYDKSRDDEEENSMYQRWKNRMYDDD